MDEKVRAAEWLPIDAQPTDDRVPGLLALARRAVGGEPCVSFVISPCHWEDSGTGYVARIPELPGCMGDGDGPDDALLDVWDALDCYLDALEERNAQLAGATP